MRETLKKTPFSHSHNKWKNSLETQAKQAVLRTNIEK